MSRTVGEIFSRVQQDLGDIAGRDFQLAEYIDACKDIADRLAFDTQVYINEYIATPNPSSAPIDPPPTTFTLPAIYKIARIDRIERNGVPCFQTGRSLVSNQNSNFYPFTANHVDFGSNAYSVTRSIDDAHVFSFVDQLQPDETILIRYFSHDDITPITWVTGTIIPQVLTEVIELGILERFLRRKMQQGLPVGIETRYPIVANRFEKAYGRAKAMTRNLIDNRSFIQIQPQRFLAE